MPTPSPGPFAETPTVEADGVRLRPLGPDDAEAMLRDLDDPEAMRLTGTHDSFTADAIRRWCATRADHDDRLDFAVVDAETGRWLGEAVINEVDVANRSCSFRIALSASARDRGVGTAATRLAVGCAFSLWPDLHRVELEVYDFNPRAHAVYTKVGFVEEGRRRDALWWDGDAHDAVVMSVVRPEWVCPPPAAGMIGR